MNILFAYHTLLQVLIHIADCPCHGRQYHDLSDNYPNGDPAGISHDEMMRRVVQNEVQYWFGYINKTYTDKMISMFNDSLRRLSEQRMLIRQFDAVQPSEVGQAVHRSVTASVFASEAAKKRHSESTHWILRFRTGVRVAYWSGTERRPPPGQLTLRRLQEGIQHEPPSVPFCFKCAPNPFTEGEESAVFHAYDVNSKRHVVLKQFRRDDKEHGCLDSYMKVAEAQRVAAAYAYEFNIDKNKPEGILPVDFVPADVVECRDGSYYIYEPFMEGRFEKFNNNQGVVASKSSYSQQLQTFSHYTWEKSGKSLLVCDLQGVGGGGRIMLTDPAIHSRGGARQYGDTDLGIDGIQVFFKTHICNDTCIRLGLKPFSTS